MTLGKEILELSLHELKENYPSYEFMVHRDVAWSLQKILNRLIEKNGYPLEVYQDYPLEKGCKEYKENELVFVLPGTNYREMFKSTSQVELVVRILFEPSRHRRDICEYHLPRILVPRLMQEMTQLKAIVESNKAKEGILILVDESSRHRKLILQNDCMKWESWGTYDDSGLNVSTLIVQYGGESLVGDRNLSE